MKKIVLITGATAGIGREAALHLALRGHHVIATGRREAALAELRTEAEARGGRIDTVRLDVTNESSIREAREMVDRLTDGYGVDVLINNAGYGLAAPLVEATDRDLRAQFDTNVFGLMAVTRAFVPPMMARRTGRVVNVASIGGRITLPLMGAYHATKYAVEALSDALRNELAPFGVRVAIVEPGPIRTEFIERLNETALPYRQESSPYAGVLERAEEIERRTMAMATGPAPVARAIARAVESRRPSARYVAPFSSAVMLTVLRMMPTPVADWLLRALFGLRGELGQAGVPEIRATA